MSVIPFPVEPKSYAVVLDWETLRIVTGRFQELHPDLLPIVIYRVLQDTWVGDLSAEQIKQALRDCYDMVKRATETERGLYSPMNFVRGRLVLCLENQALGLGASPASEAVPTHRA